MAAPAAPPPPPVGPKKSDIKLRKKEHVGDDESQVALSAQIIAQHMEHDAFAGSIVTVKVPEDMATIRNGKRKVAIVFTSDTHDNHRELNMPPQGDIFIHGGDFSNKGDWKKLAKGEIPECALLLPF